MKRSLWTTATTLGDGLSRLNHLVFTSTKHKITHIPLKGDSLPLGVIFIQTGPTTGIEIGRGAAPAIVPRDKIPRAVTNDPIIMMTTVTIVIISASEPSMPSFNAPQPA